MTRCIHCGDTTGGPTGALCYDCFLELSGRVSGGYLLGGRSRKGGGVRVLDEHRHDGPAGRMARISTGQWDNIIHAAEDAY